MMREVKINEYVLSKAKEIEDALNKGCMVLMGNTIVKSVEVVPTKRSLVVLINGIAYYPSEFVRKKIIVRCSE